MVRLTLALLAAGLFCLTMGCGNGQAQSPPWADWQVERDDHNGDATYSPDLADEEAPRVRTVLMEDMGPSGVPYDDLQDALSLLWLDMNEVEAVDVSRKDRLVVWGDVESEYGERRFAAALAPSADGPMVTAFVATEEDFEAMGGPAFIGGDPEAGQPLDHAALPTALEGQPLEEQPEVAEAPAPSSSEASVPLPVIETKEDGTGYIPGWPKDAEHGFAPRPGDATSPRLQYWTFDPGEVSSPEEAAAQAIKEIGLKKARYTAPRQIPSHAQIAGKEGYIAFGKGKAGGQQHDFALLIKKDGEDGHFTTELLHAPPAVYQSWDGVLGPLDTFGLIYSDVRTAYDAELRQQIREASPEEQSEIFVQAAELSIQLLMQQALGTMMMQHQATMGMMQQMNNNIATQTSCILTPGCQVDYDGLGNAQMAPKQE